MLAIHTIKKERPFEDVECPATKASQQFPLLATAAQKLLSAHVTTAAAERNWSAWGRTYTDLCDHLFIETAEKLVYVKANMPPEWLKSFEA